MERVTDSGKSLSPSLSFESSALPRSRGDPPHAVGDGTAGGEGPECDDIGSSS